MPGCRDTATSGGLDQQAHHPYNPMTFPGTPHLTGSVPPVGRAAENRHSVAQAGCPYRAADDHGRRPLEERVGTGSLTRLRRKGCHPAWRSRPPHICLARPEPPRITAICRTHRPLSTARSRVTPVAATRTSDSLGRRTHQLSPGATALAMSSVTGRRIPAQSATPAPGQARCRFQRPKTVWVSRISPRKASLMIGVRLGRSHHPSPGVRARATSRVVLVCIRERYVHALPDTNDSA
jgi:hypothetical protein